MKRLVILLGVLFILLGIWSAATVYIPQLLGKSTYNLPLVQNTQPVKVESEESVTVNAVKNVGPSVVTVSEQASPTPQGDTFNFGPFSMFGQGMQDQQQQNQPQSIGSGFIVSADGLIVTNKHVISDTSGKYQVITSDNKQYDVQQIYRDPLNDVAILKINPSQNSGVTLKPVTLGDSSHLQVGQFVIAIGTALGEFRNSVTTGVISGLGRGVQAGDPYQGYVENLNNVIQTSAAINPGNSGGPLVNSASQVIGINTAVAQNGQNIGFALPISVVQDSLNNFHQTGFTVPYLGVAYKTVTRDVAILNSIPQGAYVQEVVSGSPADKAGIQAGDVITSIDGTKLGTNAELASIISKKKVGTTISISLWRDGDTKNVNVTLIAAPNQ